MDRKAGLNEVQIKWDAKKYGINSFLQINCIFIIK